MTGKERTRAFKMPQKRREFIYTNRSARKTRSKAIRYDTVRDSINKRGKRNKMLVEIGEVFFF